MAKSSLRAGSLAEMTGEAGTGVPGDRGGSDLCKGAESRGISLRLYSVTCSTVE